VLNFVAFGFCHIVAVLLESPRPSDLVFSDRVDGHLLERARPCEYVGADLVTVLAVGFSRIYYNMAIVLSRSSIL
ncbi:hypothetical protein L195_g044570, partial [Trifolium pratense]